MKPASQLTGWRIEVHSERERKEAAEREMRLLAQAPQVLAELPHLDEDKIQKLIEGGVRTYEEFLETPPIHIIDLLGATDATGPVEDPPENAADAGDAEEAAA